MSKKLHVAINPLSGAIFAGTICDDGVTWGEDKSDVTLEALVAVAQNVAKFGGAVEIRTAAGEGCRLLLEVLTNETPSA